MGILENENLVKMKKILFSAAFLAVVSFAIANNNKTETKVKSTSASEAALVDFTGQIIDEVTDEPLTGVEVSIKGTEMKTYTDFDGNFKFEKVQKGTYDIVSTYISYEKETVEKVGVDQKQSGNNKIAVSEIVRDWQNLICEYT